MDVGGEKRKWEKEINPVLLFRVGEEEQRGERIRRWVEE